MTDKTELEELEELESELLVANDTADFMANAIVMAELTDEEIKVNFDDTGDAYGKSWCCKECGKNQFYTQKPVRCPHTPLSWEVQMKEQDHD